MSGEKENWTIRSFSVRFSDLPSLEKLKEAGVRDGKSQSEMVVNAIKEYIERHIPPNTQSTLTRSFATGLPVKPSWQCCVEGCKAKAKFRLQLKDFQGQIELFPVCSQHQKWRHTTFRFLLSFKELT